MEDIYLTLSELASKAHLVKKEWIYRYCSPSEFPAKNGTANTYGLQHILKMITKRENELNQNLGLANKKKSDALKSLKKMSISIKKLLTAMSDDSTLKSA